MRIHIEKGIVNISSTILIEKEKNVVWSVLQYPGSISEFHPLVKHSFTSSDIKKGNGTIRQCTLIPMGSMIEKASHWQEGTGYQMEVIGGKMMPPCEFMIGEIILSEQDYGTSVTFSLRYKMKFGFFGRIFDRLLIRSQLKKGPEKYLQGLKNYLNNK